MNRILAWACALLLAACAASPPLRLPKSNPADPEAPESVVPPRSISLQPDEATQTTDTLLNGNDTSSSEKSTSDMSAMPGMNH